MPAVWQPVEESLRGFLQSSRARSKAPCGTQNHDLRRYFGIASVRFPQPVVYFNGRVRYAYFNGRVRYAEGWLNRFLNGFPLHRCAAPGSIGFPVDIPYRRSLARDPFAVRAAEMTNVSA
jgi:hypothetical protein